MTHDMQSQDVITFWKNAGYEKWFANDDAFDAGFDQRFRGLHFRAARRELEGWMGDADGALALILLLVVPVDGRRAINRVSALE